MSHRDQRFSMTMLRVLGNGINGGILLSLRCGANVFLGLEIRNYK